MSSTNRRGEDDELESERGNSKKEGGGRAKKKGKKRHEDRLSCGLGLSRVPYQLTEEPRQREELKRFVSVLQRRSDSHLIILILKQQSNYSISPGYMCMRVISKYKRVIICQKSYPLHVQAPR